MLNRCPITKPLKNVTCSGLWKSSHRSPESAKVDIEALQETDLQLKLWGTVTGNGQNAYAVIEDVKQRVQQLYHVEDAIQDAIVKEIHREKVILEVNGSLEVLQMEEIQGGSEYKLPAGQVQESLGGPGV